MSSSSDRDEREINEYYDRVTVVVVVVRVVVARVTPRTSNTHLEFPQRSSRRK